LKKQTIRDLDLQGKRIVMRVDFNVPIADSKVADDTRITAALPSIQYIMQQGASVVLLSHLGRPKGKADPKFSLQPVAERLSELLNKSVIFAPNCIGPEVQELASALKPGEVLLLENLRFHPEEEGKVKLPDTATDEEKKLAKAELKQKQESFAKQLAELGDIYVNDAFGSAHRAHASTAIIAKYTQNNAAGFLMEREIDYLGRALSDPERPFIAILGGAKVSDKVNVIVNLLPKVDVLLIGGAMAYTFYRAKGLPTGKSLVEEDKIALAQEILEQAITQNTRLLLPIDHIIADSFDSNAHTETVGEDGIKDGWLALDIGPKTANLFSDEIKKAKTVIWNGPMGCFEMEPFAQGTLAVAQALANTHCLSIVGGGDSVSAVKQSGLADKMTHISTGGGACLEFLEGKQLPGVTALKDKS
jgi:phosphoglycerate kinase